MGRKKKKGKKPVKYEKVDCVHVEREGTMAIYVDEECEGPWHYLKGQRVVYRLKCRECNGRKPCQ